MSRGEVHFLHQWLRHPRQVGAIAPSGRQLATAMAHTIDPHEPGAVIELGGGTGSITQALLEVGIPADDLVIIESDPHYCRLLALRFKDIRIWHADAADLPTLVKNIGISRIKAVVSSLPLLSMLKDDRLEIIEAVFNVLADTGQLIQFTYGLNDPLPGCLPVTRERLRWIPWNLPPATIWSYRHYAQSDPG